jgi:Ni/Fe-hydrogenase subunit HybB-like protein
MYLRQFDLGLVTTGMDRPAYWGMYIVNFIFLIGVSMAGTVVAAILLLTGVNWRRPITRIAEATTVAGLMVAGLQITVDMGRPDRLLSLLIYGRLQSPLLWDVAALTLYLLVSMFALYISLIPDLGIVRDNMPARARGWRRLMYTALALGWRGNREQWLRLQRLVRIVAIVAIPIGISLHTVTSWILSTTLQPGWHSTILAPYFVVGAIFSGIALLFILVTIVRAISGVRYYINERHYRNLGWLLITMSLVWFYFTYTEHLTMLAGQDAVEWPVLASKLWGPDAPYFWAMLALMGVAVLVLTLPVLLPEHVARTRFSRPRLAAASAASAGVAYTLGGIPQFLPVAAGLHITNLRPGLVIAAAGLAITALLCALAWLKAHVEAHIVIASVAIVVGMWLERWNIVIPTLTHPRMVAWAPYTPTATEWSLTAASFALFVLLLLIFFKLFPAVSLWEVEEGRVVDMAQSRVEIPLPPQSSTSIATYPAMPRRQA